VATRRVSIPLQTTRTILSVAPTGEISGANPLEQRVGGARPTRTAVALSPDGKTLVFGAIWGGSQQLYRRAMDQLSAIPISSTSGGSSPFFSPDGQWVAFAADGELRMVPLGGGPPVTLCKAAALWSRPAYPTILRGPVIPSLSPCNTTRHSTRREASLLMVLGQRKTVGRFDPFRDECAVLRSEHTG
jgi:hypothetical protein